MRTEPSRPSREHPRVVADFAVLVDVGGRELGARARNLSMAGLYLDGPLPISGPHAHVRVRLPLPGVSREVQTTCRIERRDRAGVALSFASMDWDDLLLLARYLSPRL